MEIYGFFINFTFLLPRRKTDAEKSIILKYVGFKKFLAFWKEDHSLKIIGDLYELDNFKQKIFLKKKFQNWDSKCHFSDDFLRKWKFFLIDRSNLTRYSETRSLSDQNCKVKKFWILKVTKKIDVKK